MIKHKTTNPLYFLPFFSFFLRFPPFFPPLRETKSSPPEAQEIAQGRAALRLESDANLENVVPEASGRSARSGFFPEKGTKAFLGGFFGRSFVEEI